MAQIREVRLVDDLDGEAADETVEFGIDGKNYEIDLSKENAGRLRDALADFVSAARRAGGRGASSAGTGTASGGAGSAPKGRTAIDREQNQAIRDWARKARHEGLRPRPDSGRGPRGLPQGELRFFRRQGPAQVRRPLSSWSRRPRCPPAGQASSAGVATDEGQQFGLDVRIVGDVDPRPELAAGTQ